MTPTPPSLDVSHCCLGDAVYHSNGVSMLASGKSHTNVCNAFRCEFRASVFGACVRRAVKLLVGVVVFVRVVTKITEAIIHWVAIVVANVCLRRARADECSHDQCMNKKRLRFIAVSAELHRTVSVLACSRLQHHRAQPLCLFGAAITQDDTIVTNEVSWEGINWSKCWGGNVHVSDCSVSYAKLRD